MSKLSQMSGSHIAPIAAMKPRRDLVVELWGDEATGKTKLATTAVDIAPGGVYYQTFEARRSNDVLRQATGNIVVGTYDSEIPPGVNRAEADIKKYFQNQLIKVKNDMAQALKLGASVIVWDKAIDLWEVIRYAHFGKLMGMMQLKYGPANSEFIDMSSLPGYSGASLIMINESEEEWGNAGTTDDGKAIRQPTGAKVSKSQLKTPFLIDISVRMFTKGKPPKFFGEITTCKPATELIGTVLENPTFEEVATLARPEVAWR